MSFLKRAMAIGASSALLATGAVAFASSAQAASQCTGAAGGWLCISTDPRGYGAEFTNGGTTQYLDFNLQCGITYGDGGSFYAFPGDDKSYTFAVGSKGYCNLELLDGHSHQILGAVGLSR
ncbi:hypothetical protein OG455_24720 [Kitasatospora sp. NBC_01287]|uniref:hypothetical protein n=1 Tax=Kitasatospora sp. NBC_01287 TaxID=2903573 RepID=UPI00224DD0A6|nr:hypothetical protein [Kitasatospora sp. NBC_01287]MCX4748683.1 hypothetical protein [Kitasatospora sp. NBC_01287]